MDNDSLDEQAHRIAKENPDLPEEFVRGILKAETESFENDKPYQMSKPASPKKPTEDMPTFGKPGDLMPGVKLDSYRMTQDKLDD